MPYLDTINEKRRQKSERIQAEYTATKLAAVLKEHLKSYKPEADKSVLKHLEAIEKACSKDDSHIISILEEIRDSVGEETVVVPAPTVKVRETTLDTSRLEVLLKEIIDRLSVEAPIVEKAPEAAEPLTHYAAQDLDNAPDGSQYIGFMSISGNWYIMHHDTETDKNRYYFGEGSYEDEWDKRYSLEFKPLSEAR